MTVVKLRSGCRLGSKIVFLGPFCASETTMMRSFLSFVAFSTSPRTPTVSAGELASGANVKRTDVPHRHNIPDSTKLIFPILYPGKKSSPTHFWNARKCVEEGSKYEKREKRAIFHDICAVGNLKGRFKIFDF